MSKIKFVTKTLALVCLLLSSSIVFSSAINWVNKPTNSGTFPDGSDGGTIKISKNGRFIAFRSTSSNLVDGDVNLTTDLFIKNNLNNSTSLISRTASGNQLSSSVRTFSRPTSTRPALGGPSIAFVSDDDSLAMANGTNLLYFKNILSQNVTALSYDNGSTPITISGDDIYLTDDEQYIYFKTENDIMANDTNGKADIYRMDLTNGSFDLISIALSGQSPIYSNYKSQLIDVSEDGRYVLFSANSGDFHADATLTSYIGYIRDMQLNTTQIYTVNHLGDATYFSSSIKVINSVVTDSGKVYFCSEQSNLVLNDNNDLEDLFKYENGVVSRIEFDTVAVEIEDSGCETSGKNLSVTVDDSYLLFPHPSQDLHPDANGSHHLYKLDLSNHHLELISNISNEVYSVSSSFTNNIDISTSSNTVVFSSSDTQISPGTYGSHGFSLNMTSNISEPVAQASHPALVQNSFLFKAKVSDDQNHIFYTTRATNASADSNLVLSNDLYHFNRLTNTTTRIAEYITGEMDVSPNGRYTVFISTVFHPITTIPLDSATVFLYDNQTAVYSQIAPGSDPTVNDEGNVVFVSEESTLVNSDNNGSDDIFIFNRVNQSIDRVNVADNGDEAQGGDSSRPQIAGEGLSTWIVFDSSANNLIANDTNNKADVFLVNWPNGSMQRISEINGVGGDSGSNNPFISSDTSTVVFYTSADNLIGTTTIKSQLLKFDRALNSLQLISQTPNSIPSTESISDNFGLSSDGQYIAFSTNASLIPEDSNSIRNIYLHDATTNELRIVATESEQPYVLDVSSDLSFTEAKLGILFSDSNVLLGDLYGMYAVSDHSSGFLYQEGGDGETLTVEISGNGQVIGALGLNCQSDCSNIYTLGYELTLTAIAPSGQEFVGWQGDCLQQDNASDITCDIRMDESKTIRAQFIDENDRIFVNGFED